MKYILIPILSFVAGFSLNLFNGQNHDKEKLKPNPKIINENKIEKQVIKTKEKNIEYIPNFVLNDIQKEGFNTSKMNKKIWEDFKELKKDNIYLSFTKNLNTNTFVHEAITNKNFTLAKKLIKLGFNLNNKGKEGMTPLVLAAYNNADLDFIKLLVENGAEVIDESRRGKLGILTALLLNKETLPSDTIDYLLSQGINIHRKHLPFLSEFEGEKVDEYKMNFLREMEINDMQNYNEDDLGLDAIKSIITDEKNNDIITYVLDNKVDFKTYPHKNLLYYAVGNENISEENFKRIIEATLTNINEGTPTNTTPLMNAVVRGDIKKIKILLDYNADINVKDLTGRTVYDWLKIKESMPIEKKEKIINLLKTYKSN